MRRFSEDVALILEARGMLMIDIANTLPELPPQAGMHPGEKAYRDRLKPEMAFSAKDGIARIPIEGTLAHNPDTFEMAYFGMEDLRNISSMIAEAGENRDVKGVLLSVDSPGGFFTGSLDVADSIAALNNVKPVIAHVSGTSASLAYMLTSQAGEIVAGRGSSVGSLGAYIVNADYSRAYKNAGLEMEMFKNKEGSLKGMGSGEFALTAEQRQFLSDRAQGTFESFMNVIETARGVIRPDAKKGRTFYGEQAKSKGLVDRIGSESFARGLLKAKL
ncbi:MAG TPA: S49 family peptidase [Verrucomicrobiae bacterium]|nr:S49 family peptidase [Verrucomicrobiae bacterium]